MNHSPFCGKPSGCYDFTESFRPSIKPITFISEVYNIVVFLSSFDLWVLLYHFVFMANLCCFIFSVFCAKNLSKRDFFRKYCFLWIWLFCPYFHILYWYSN